MATARDRGSTSGCPFRRRPRPGSVDAAVGSRAVSAHRWSAGGARRACRNARPSHGACLARRHRTDAHTQVDQNGDRDPNPESDEDPDAETHAHANTYGNPDTHQDQNPDAHAHGDCDPDTNACRDRNPNGHANPDPDAHPDADADERSRLVGYVLRHADGNRIGRPVVNRDGDARALLDEHPDPGRLADRGPLGHALANTLGHADEQRNRDRHALGDAFAD
jgi:hypothetical protein